MIDRPDDVLTRFLAMEETGAPVRLTEDEIVDNLIGLAIGWLWHGAKAALGAVDVLLDRPEALATAAAAARDNELERLRQVIWEALRFHAVQVGLPRVCAHATTLAAGTPYETEVPAGAVSWRARTRPCGTTGSFPTRVGSIPAGRRSTT